MSSLAIATLTGVVTFITLFALYQLITGDNERCDCSFCQRAGRE